MSSKLQADQQMSLAAATWAQKRRLNLQEVEEGMPAHNAKGGDKGVATPSYTLASAACAG